MNDQILVSKLELVSRIGITAQEREKAQRLTASLVLHPRTGFSGMADRIENTVDYFKVCMRIRDLAARGERNLIETLAEEIAKMVLSDFAVRAVEIELRKYVMRETEFVAVKIHRENPNG